MHTKNSNSASLRIVSWGTPEITLMPSLIYTSKEIHLLCSASENVTVSCQ